MGGTLTYLQIISFARGREKPDMVEHFLSACVIHLCVNPDPLTVYLPLSKCKYTNESKSEQRTVKLTPFKNYKVNNLKWQ